MKKTEVIFFDFGGVIAEEGFREGLYEIANINKFDRHKFFGVAVDTIYETGYIIGQASESDYWNVLRSRTGISMSNLEMRLQILQRFELRPQVLELVDKLRGRGYYVALLSDQTNWLDELDAFGHFSCRFDAVFNSYHFGKGKRDASFFTDVAACLGVEPESCLFIDDNPENLSRASSRGYKTILYQDLESLKTEINAVIGD